MSEDSSIAWEPWTPPAEANLLNPANRELIADLIRELVAQQTVCEPADFEPVDVGQLMNLEALKTAYLEANPQ